MLTLPGMVALAGVVLWGNAALVGLSGARDAAGLVRRLLALLVCCSLGVLREGRLATNTERVARRGADGRLHVRDLRRTASLEAAVVELGGQRYGVPADAELWSLDEDSGAAWVWRDDEATPVWCRREVPIGAQVWVVGARGPADAAGVPDGTLTGLPHLDGRVLLSVDDPRRVLVRRLATLVFGHILGIGLVGAATALVVWAPLESPVSRAGGVVALGVFLLLLPLGVARLVAGLGVPDPVLRWMDACRRAGLPMDRPLVPCVLPAHVLQLGQVVLGAVAGKPTSEAGARIVAALAPCVPEAHTVLLVGYANAYAGYVATPEEYSMQRYEGGHTLFGPCTLGAWQVALRDAAGALEGRGSVVPGPRPEIVDRATLDREREVGRG